MKISIITPVTQHDAMLDATMESVLEQSYPDSEHIVAWYREHSGKDISETTDQHKQDTSIKTRTFREALNKSLKHVSGEYILILQSGKTFTTKDTLKKIMEALSKTNSNLMYGKSRVFNDNDVLNNMIGRWDKKRNTHPLPFGKIPLNTVIVIKRSLLLSAGLMTGNLSVNSEYELNLKMFMHPGIKPYFMDEYLIKPTGLNQKEQVKTMEKTKKAATFNLDGLKYITNLW